MSQQQTLQQRRAKAAYEAVEQVSHTVQGEYGPLVRGLPAMVKNEGLATTLSFLKAKGKAHHLAAYEHLSAWVMNEFNQNENQDLLKWLVSVDSFTYRQASTEALAYLSWLKRFAEAKGIADNG